MFEYIQLISPGDNLLSVDFITRVALLIFSGLILVAVGYKIKGIWGSVVAIVLGSLFFFSICNPPLIRKESVGGANAQINICYLRADIFPLS